MYSIPLINNTLQSLRKQVHDIATWGDAQATRALSLASTLFWSPVTVPFAVYQFSLSLYPTQALVLKPALALHASKTDGRYVTLLLTDSDGTVCGRQPVWVSWEYSAASIVELVEKHLQLQDKKLWVDSLGIVNQRLFKTVYEALPEQAKAKDFAMPLVTLAALVSPRQVSLDSIDGSSAVPSSEAHSLSANKKGNGSGGKFFVKAAADGAGTSNNGKAPMIGSGLLASHPINLHLSPGASDLDTPVSSPMSGSSNFSPFK